MQITKDDLEAIGKYIATGMTEQEACILADVSHSDFLLLKEKNSKIRDFVEKKKVRFKYAHLNEIQKNKSDKNSQWLLEKLVPEFSPKAKNDGGNTINIISQIIKEIQNESEPIIDITRGSRVELGTRTESDQKIKVAEILN